MYKIIFDGYEYEDEYDTYDEAYEAALEMKSAFNQGSIDLYLMNPGDYEEEADGNGDFKIVER